VLRGWIADWPSLEWRLDRIADHWPKRAFRARENYPGGFAERDFTLTPEALNQQLGAPNPPDAGLAWCFDVFKDAPELLSDFPPPFVHGSPSTYLLLVGRDTATGTHYHPLQHALLCVVQGKKRVVMHRPADSQNLYPRSILRNDFHISRVDMRAPDLQRFPKVVATRPVEATLEAGDALFIPVGWWHTVYGIGTTLSVSLFWGAPWRNLHFPQPGLRSLAGMLLRRARRLVSRRNV
jgi:hypothetical protein